jgi:RimJ/RimL family protein N-acetyltransferase
LAAVECLSLVFERFTEAARKVVVSAQDAARELGHGHIGTERNGTHLVHDHTRPTEEPASRAKEGRFDNLTDMHPMEPIDLRGDVVTIEPLELTHASGLLTAADSDEIFAWLPYTRPADLGEARAWIEDALADRAAARRFAVVCRASDGAVIGSTSFWEFDAHNRSVEIGSTWLSRAPWRTGANLEAKLLLISHAFEMLELERVAFRTDIRNERSQRAIERLGAVREGVHRHEKLRRDRTWRDSVHDSILRSEWPSAKERLTERLRGVAGLHAPRPISEPKETIPAARPGHVLFATTRAAVPDGATPLLPGTALLLVHAPHALEGDTGAPATQARCQGLAYVPARRGPYPGAEPIARAQPCRRGACRLTPSGGLRVPAVIRQPSHTLRDIPPESRSG